MARRGFGQSIHEVDWVEPVIETTLDKGLLLSYCLLGFFAFCEQAFRWKARILKDSEHALRGRKVFIGVRNRELVYCRTNDAFEYYQKSIKKILKDENVIANIPAIVPPDFPQELLGGVWRNFVGFFRDPAMNFTEESHPEAYKLLRSFSPGAQKSHPRLERTPRSKILLKAMQITAGLTLGLLAWDKRDRATAAKRYREALDLAETHLPFISLPPVVIGLEMYVHNDLQATKTNLGMLVLNDTLNAEMVADKDEGDQVPGRRDVVDLPVPQMRIEKTGAVTLEHSLLIATNACAHCGNRDPKLLRCALCKTTLYCNGECQRVHWPVHKKSCAGRVGKS